MKHRLSAEQKHHLDSLITAAEKNSGAQIVLAVVERSDSYAELPWKAFGLGAVALGLIVGVSVLGQPAWLPSQAALLSMAVVMAGGLVSMLACLFVRPYARLLLDGHRAIAQVHRGAQAMFCERELFATRQRAGILLYVSLFEHRMVLLPDKGVRSRLSPDAIQMIITRVSAALADGHTAQALETGLLALQEALGVQAPPGVSDDDLPNAIIEEKGI